MEVAKVLTNASDSFEKMKAEMDAIKVVSQSDLKAMQDAIKKMESEIRNNAGNAAGNWPTGNSYSKSAMEHKAISNLENLGNDRQGYRQWHAKLVNAMAHVHREDRVVMQLIVRAI